MKRSEHLDDRPLLIEPSATGAPLKMAATMGCWATVLLAVLIDMALFALMLAGEVAWAFWPYPAVPAALWVILLGIPAFYRCQRGVMAILDAIVKTAEAYLARAGYVVDLNRDGQIGHVQPIVQPPKVQEVRPLLMNAPQRAAILPLDVPAVGEGGEPEPEREIPARRLWHCPGGVKVEQEVLEDFVDGVFSKGLTRGKWVPGILDRETYDALVALLEQARLVEGRKPGHAGRLAVRTARQARAVLGLPLTGGE